MSDLVKNKNPLRQLASAIVSACRKDGAKKVKQTTVLNVLSQDQGFRSIQCTDQPSLRPSISPHVIFLQGLLYSGYDSSDMLPIVFEKEAGLPLIPKDVGNFVFVYFWNLFLQGERGLMNKICDVQVFLGILDVALHESELSVVDFIRDEKKLSSLNDFDAEGKQDWIKFIIDECLECSADEENEHDVVVAQKQALDKIIDDVNDAKWSVEGNVYARQIT